MKEKILLIGSGPIIIGQGCEFDYSGSQACKAVLESEYELILVNSNPSTIMTDKDMATKTYLCSLSLENIERIIEKEKPNYLLASYGGQTALNLTVRLQEKGTLEKNNIKVLGTDINTIIDSEDREKFKRRMKEIDIDVPKSFICKSLSDIDKIKEYPVVIRPSYTLGGLGANLCKDYEELRNTIEYSLERSIKNECLLEESIYGWQELEIEIIRDKKSQSIIICEIENIDPVGIHTGDSICVSPFINVSNDIINKIYDISKQIVNHLNIIGACNIQYAYNKSNNKLVVIEINPRTSRSSALASKATGFPIAYISTKLSLGKTLDELPYYNGNNLLDYKINKDYCVVKIPKFNFDKFGYQELGMSMKSVGEVLGLGLTFEEAKLKAEQSIVETGSNNLQAYKKIRISGINEEKYYFFSYSGIDENIIDNNKNKVIVIGSGPNRIGQGIEFDYCCVHACKKLKELGYYVIMINSNPETVSTDYDIADKLYFEPITVETVNKIYDIEKPIGVLTQYGGQTSLNILKELKNSNLNILGIDFNVLEKTEDRNEFRNFMKKLKISIPKGEYISSLKENKITYPIIARPSYIIGGSGIKIIRNKKELKDLFETKPVGIYIDEFMENCLECEVDVLTDGKDFYYPAVIEQIDKSGIHSGDSKAIIPSKSINECCLNQIKNIIYKIIKRLNLIGLFNIQFLIKENKVYVIEINPRCSRTVSIVSKIYNYDLVGKSIELILGKTINDIDKALPVTKYGYKEPVFSNYRFNQEIKLGPEMFSTGEILNFL